MKFYLKKEKGQMQFAWIFAVIVGALILFLAFYFVGTRLMQSQYEQATIEAQSLDIMLNPFSYLGSLAEATYYPVELPKKRKIIFDCSAEGDLGSNTITLQTLKGKVEGIPRKIYDKYIYLDTAKVTEFKKLEALSKPLEFPWRVADVMILWPPEQEYCFVGAPTRIKNEVGSLNIDSIKIETLVSACKDSISVCFDTSGCSINVRGASLGYGEIIKKNGAVRIYWAGDALLYAGIFSDKATYNCNLQRLAKRLNIQCSVYEEKTRSLSARGCSTIFNLEPLKRKSDEIAVATNIQENDLKQLYQASKTLKRANEAAYKCNLF